MVVPIILYGAEIWGIHDFKEVDKIILKFLKNLLGVRQQTPSVAAYGEVGRFPLSVIAKVRFIKFWIKVMKSPNSVIHSAFMDQCNNMT